ncbi:MULTISPECIES: GtrA family protein [Amycolatopsis]|uniref:GtrA family protein n=2 Tax=Amycolatopsis TaxID=1813 RepID=A0ABP9R3S2_9PSEU|nr:GtrA family protein [Amycolatopsis sacchari]SFJ91754.1 Putative flippase GtrA (transmembrane translocase of bactoprenol-linked glucose) [Amycolatopsis sacchari]
MVSTEPQETTETPKAAPGLVGQLLRFALIGGFCALLDLGIYTLELALGMDAQPWPVVARAVSFIVGTTTAFFLNRKFTFSAGRKDGAGQIGGFVLLYGVTFFVAVGMNSLMLAVLPEFTWKKTVAWVISQGTATVINFVMLKWVVFRERPAAA